MLAWTAMHSPAASSAAPKTVTAWSLWGGAGGFCRGSCGRGGDDMPWGRHGKAVSQPRMQWSTQGKGSALATKGSENARRRQCLFARRGSGSVPLSRRRQVWASLPRGRRPAPTSGSGPSCARRTPAPPPRPGAVRRKGGASQHKGGATEEITTACSRPAQDRGCIISSVPPFNQRDGM